MPLSSVAVVEMWSFTRGDSCTDSRSHISSIIASISGSVDCYIVALISTKYRLWWPAEYGLTWLNGRWTLMTLALILYTKGRSHRRSAFQCSEQKI